jgi:ribosomal protein S18
MGLWQHSKKCDAKTNNQSPVENPVMDTAMIMNIIKENQEFKALLFEQSKQVMELQAKQSEMLLEFQKENKCLINKLTEREPVMISGDNNCNSTTNNNQKFNLNFFLNETCKDAMNIQEFMENLRITFQDLLKIGNEGFVTGVSDIFIKELRELDVSKRPIHCTDAKRETIYLKDNGEWNKDDKEKTKLKQVIEKVEYKNVAVLQQWCNDTPDAKINNSGNNLLRDKIYLQTLQGDDKTRDKIIKNISKEVLVDKD